MTGNSAIYDFFLENIQKIVVPDELIKLELSLSRFELVALLLADRKGEMTMTGLAQGLSVPMSTATGIVDRLVKKGYLKRDRSEEDRRIVTVDLTDIGTEMVKGVQAHFHDFLNRIRCLLTEEELETALKIMQKVITGLGRRDETDKKPIVRKRIEID